MKRSSLVEDIKRLRDLDAALRGEGVNVPALAEEWGTTTRTVHRQLDALRELCGPTEATRGDDGRFLQRYTGKPKQFFAK